jgi:hypothetical protein
MPVKYGDLSKKADDLFSKGFEHAHYKVEFASKNDGFEFTTKGALKGDAIASSLEVKHTCPVSGMKVKKTLDPSKSKADVEFEYTKVAKVTAVTSWPITGCPVPQLNKVKLAWSNDKANVNLDTNAKDSLNFDAVVAACPSTNVGVKAGLGFDGSIKSKELACNFTKGNINATVKTSINNDFNAVFHNQVDAGLQLATSVTYGSGSTSLAIAGKKAGGCGTSNAFMLRNNGQLALSHTTPFHSCSKLTVSALCDATNLASGSHKIGACLKFDL